MNVDVENLSRDQLLNGPGTSTSQNAYCNGTGQGCFHVIRMDGWKISDDYPC